MHSTDPAGELRRLQELYGRMTDEQLEDLADSADELTNIAQDVLRSEISLRHLKVALLDASQPEPQTHIDHVAEDLIPKNLDLVEAYRAWSKDEAQQAKSAIESAGVPCYLGPRNVENVSDFDGDFESGVQVRVPRVLLARAWASLKTKLPDKENVDTEEPPIQYKCPNCRSDEIVFEELEKESAEQPDFQAAFHWHCDACGHQWREK